MEMSSRTGLAVDDSTDADFSQRLWNGEQDVPFSRPADTRQGTSSERRVLSLARRIVSELFGEREERGFAVRYWTALEERAAGTPALPPFTLVLRSPGSLRRMLVPPTETRFAEAFLRGDFDIDGNLESAAALASPIAQRLRSTRRLLRIAKLLAQLPRDHDALAISAATPPQTSLGSHAWRGFANGRRHARMRDAHAVRHHYDVGNDFYALFLDEHHAYSCAYFPTGTENLERAQEAKFDLICRKLRLRPGERLLDIGCGWGGLIRYAVKNYGVIALGITLSEAQAALARETIALDGLGEQCRILVCDYRDLARDLSFDKVASVGMFEHVGRAQLHKYFTSVMRLLRPGGLFLNHGIISLDDARARSAIVTVPRRLWGQGRFMDRYVFPDGELVTLATAVGTAEAAGFETRDMESLREHYTETLRHWMRRLDNRLDEARALVGDVTVRVWRLYMAASAHAFATARIGIVQLVLTRPTSDGRCDLPRTRSDLYDAR